MEKIKSFFKTYAGQQVYSFIKTYVTVFIGIYLTLNALMESPEMSAIVEADLLDLNIIAISAKGALISFFRNIYKLLTEK